MLDDAIKRQYAIVEKLQNAALRWEPQFEESLGEVMKAVTSAVDKLMTLEVLKTNRHATAEPREENS